MYTTRQRQYLLAVDPTTTAAAVAGLPLTKEEEDLVAERCSYQEQNKKGEVEYMYKSIG